MIRFNKVSVKYDKETYAIKDLTLNIKDGEFVFIVGKTGAGKSTLFKLLTREIKPYSGSIKVFNENIEYINDNQIPYYRRNLGVIFQDFKLLEDRNAFENISFAQEVIGVNPFKIKKHVIKLLNIVGLRNKAQKMPYELSGGEKQKVAVARAIINKPKILLADEPTGNLDEISTNEIMSLLDSINQNGTTVVVITHDMHLVERMKKRVIRLDEGNIVYDDVGLDDQIKSYIENE
ncbi:MAG: cell division ATP-binding protein FtsE [Lachnospiraceae bacterium]|nr:cell division ATP-binding protein FtsE [Lachnospiraceae bacterium]